MIVMAMGADYVVLLLASRIEGFVVVAGYWTVFEVVSQASVSSFGCLISCMANMTLNARVARMSRTCEHGLEERRTSIIKQAEAMIRNHRPCFFFSLGSSQPVSDRMMIGALGWIFT